jgi:hypothetical protein
MSVSKRLRYEVMARDGFACRYCHRDDVALEIDHVIPVALGGQDVPENLVAACMACNRGKASTNPDKPLVEGVADDSLRWADAMRRAAELQREKHNAIDQYRADFAAAWQPRSMPANWRSTIDRWFALGIEIETLYDCVDIAFRAQFVESRWSYFCGAVWRRVTERQDMARELLAEEESGAS